ncbi:MAG: VWA domain-containing protein [Acidobacteria bacterium]|nr:VWA domain-containing protein [Acidobacteriota bacterium]
MNSRQQPVRGTPPAAPAGIFRVILLPLLFLIAPPAPAQQQPVPTGPTLKVTTEVVNVYAVVRNKHGQLIPDLSKNDFEIKEDNVPQKIRYFSRETDTPLTLAIMIDTSPSQERVLPTEKKEADAFLRQVLRPKDLACVIHFDVDVELLQDFTNDQRWLAHAIDETVINGGGQGMGPRPLPTRPIGATHLYDAVYLASNELMKHEVGRKVLILLTDGQDQGSQETLNQALEAAQRSNVMIYSIDIVDRAFYGFGNLGFRGGSVLQKLSQQTGGRVLKVNKIKNTREAFDEIARELRTQYLLGYTPSNLRKDPGFRKISVRVLHGDYKVQARNGYYPHS